MRNRFACLLLSAACLVLILAGTNADRNSTGQALSAGNASSAAAVTASRARRVKVRFHAGIYRDWDKNWMTTAPEDVVATLTSSEGTAEKHPVDYTGLIVFDGVPCGESITIELKFVGTASYRSNSRRYTRRLACGSPVANLGRLEYGTW